VPTSKGNGKREKGREVERKSGEGKELEKRGREWENGNVLES